LTLSLASEPPIGYFAARMRPRPPGRLALPIALLVLVAGCTATTDTTLTAAAAAAAAQPILEIDPAEFLSVTPDLVCADLPGGMRSYVVTFIDLGPDTADGASASGYPLALPSSAASPCSQRVAFSNGVVGHRYIADVDGYEEAAADLVGVCSSTPPYAACLGTGKAPIGAGLCHDSTECLQHGCYGVCTASPRQSLNNGVCETVAEKSCTKNDDCDTGVCEKTGLCQQAKVCLYTAVQGDRHQVHAGTLAAVTPRWRSRASEPCGWLSPSAPGPYERGEIRPCAPLVDSNETTPTATGIKVLPAGTLGSLACVASDGDGGTTGQITKFDVVPGQAGLFPKLGVACAADKSALFEQGVLADQSYTFTVSAYADAGPAVATALCFATAQQGLIVLAKCDPLVPVGGATP
jgi:hypothetical protein